MGKRVLVVDDDVALVRLLRLILENQGLTVLVARDGEEALHQLRNTRPDAIVLDLEMPVMDGAAFFRAMRARGIDTPVLILSIHDTRAARRMLGAQAAMDKPFDPDDLAWTVNALVDRRSVAAAGQ